MKSEFFQLRPMVGGGAGVRFRAVVALRFLCLVVATAIAARVGQAQTAKLHDAWWTYTQDCNGDGCKAGLLPNDRARLNWHSEAADCDGLLTVYEIVYAKPCASNAWTAIYTNVPHLIAGCRSSDGQYLDVPMAAGCACRDYKIETYQSGQTTPDDSLAGTNAPDLYHHPEQLLSEDYCFSDMFATCAALNGSVGTRSENNAYATKEPGEPNHAGDTGGRSLWFCWTAPTSTPVTFDTSGSGFDTVLAVYTGTTVSNLSLIISNDDIAGADNRQSRVTFTPASGMTYHIAVDGYGGASGLVNFIWNQGSLLPDLVLYGPAVSPTITTRTFATNDCEVLEGCETPGTHRLLNFNTESHNIGLGDMVLGDPATNSLFQYAACHGHYHFEDYCRYTLVDNYSNVVADGHKVGFCLTDDHMWNPTANPQVIYDCNYQGLQAGWADVYEIGLPCQYIDITGVPAGSYLLKMEVNQAGVIPESDTNNNVAYVSVNLPPTDCASPPANNFFTNAVVIGSAPFTIQQFNACATKEPGEPNHAGNAGGHSLWYRWTTSVSQFASVNTKRSDFDTLLAVYTGSSVSTLSLVASNDDIVSDVYKQSELSFTATAGTTYWIAVDGWGGAVGTVVLNVNPPGNDDFASAYAISGAAGTTNGFNLNASKEPNEPAHAYDVGGHSVWYSWTAPTNGPVEFNTAGSTFSTILAVYTNSVLPTNLLAIASNAREGGGLLTSRVHFNASSGRTYHIALDGATGATGYYWISWNMLCHLSVNLVPTNRIQINVTGVSSQRYQLQTSTNLADWIPLAHFTVVGDSISVLDNLRPGPAFYRAVGLP